MRYGNITLHAKPRLDPDWAPEQGICSCCLHETELVPIDNSYDDLFGTITDWTWGSRCCEAEVLEGEIFLDHTSTHTAQKDHVVNGKVIVAKGQRYNSRVIKGYYIDETGNHKGIFLVEKRTIKQ